MPLKTPKACRIRGCLNTTTGSDGYCSQHKGENWKPHKTGQTRHQRGYGSQWDMLRKRILKRDKGLCQDHLRQGLTKQASCVDHIKAKAHYDPDVDFKGAFFSGLGMHLPGQELNCVENVAIYFSKR
ncbi:HNH endonuclease [Citrobacter portucalensis]|uniref:HNH endonuclease n=1 Tax=Citrobacter portucalensis TaxID=1639133 RepID=UPI003C2E7351